LEDAETRAKSSDAGDSQNLRPQPAGQESEQPRRNKQEEPGLFFSKKEREGEKEREKERKRERERIYKESRGEQRRTS
jgi:hypothetical protein